MKRMIGLWGLLLLGSSNLLAQENVRNLTVKISNPEKTVKADEPVVIRLKELGLEWNVCSAIVKDGSAEIPSQLDDLNQDGEADELVFLTDVPARGSKKIQVTLSAQPNSHKYTPRVYAQMKLNDKGQKFPKVLQVMVPGSDNVKHTYSMMYHHGVAFESELTGYRIYFDNRQSIDLYGKVRRQLELSTTNFYSQNFVSQGYGCDVLWAGQSVGLGSFRGWDGNNPTYVDSVEIRGQRILANGPLRTVVEIVDRGWYYQGQTLSMTQRYTQYAGHRDVKVEIRFDRPLHDVTFCTGVQKLETDNVGFILEDGLTGSWGSNLPDKKDSITFPRETIGLGVYVAPRYIRSYLDHADNYLYILGNEGGTELSYHLTFCALKEEKGYRSMKEWTSHLKAWARRLSSPCKIEIKKQ